MTAGFRMLVVLMAVSSSTAYAQDTVTIDQKLPSTGFRFNGADCVDDEAKQVFWRLNAPNGTYFWKLTLHNATDKTTGGLCPGLLVVEGEDIIPFADEPTLAASNGFLVDEELTPDDLLVGGCDDDGRRGNYIICLYVTDLNQLDVVFSDFMTLDADTDIPASPTIANVATGDQRLIVDIDSPEPVDNENLSVSVAYRPCAGFPDPFFVTTTTTDAGTDDSAVLVDVDSTCGATVDFKSVATSSSGRATLTNLFNGVDYEIFALAKDDFENTSSPSEVILASPVPELSPLGVYDGEPNPVSSRGPTCQQIADDDTPASFTFLMFVCLAIVLASRRGRRRTSESHRLSQTLFAVLLLGVEVVPGTARADFGQLTAALKVGPYVPNIDGEIKTNGDPIYPIYKCFYDDNIVPQLGGDLDLHLFDMFGSVQAGLGFHLTQIRGSTYQTGALTAEMISNGTCPSSSAAGTGSTELSLLALKPSLTYRFDPLLEAFRFPLVPYARVGLVGVGYVFSRDGAFDNAASSSGKNPVGMRFGYEVAVGMMLALDFVDLLKMWDLAESGTTHRGFRRSSFVKRSYFFVEGVHQGLNNFGGPGFDFSPTDRLFGSGRVFGRPLPVTFQVGVAVDLL